MKKIISLLLLASIAGCAQSTVYIKPEPYSFQKAPLPGVQTIRVHVDDEKLYKAYIDELRARILFHHKQIDDYLSDFK